MRDQSPELTPEVIGIKVYPSPRLVTTRETREEDENGETGGPAF